MSLYSSGWQVDKKVADGLLRLILLKGPLGNCVFTGDYDRKALDETLRAFVKSWFEIWSWLSSAACKFCVTSLCLLCLLFSLYSGWLGPWSAKFYWQVLWPSCNFKNCGMLNNSCLGIYIIFLCSFLIYSFHVTVSILVILSSFCFWWCAWNWYEKFMAVN